MYIYSKRIGGSLEGIKVWRINLHYNWRLDGKILVVSGFGWCLSPINLSNIPSSSFPFGSDFLTTIICFIYVCVSFLDARSSLYSSHSYSRHTCSMVHIGSRSFLKCLFKYLFRMPAFPSLSYPFKAGFCSE